MTTLQTMESFVCVPNTCHISLKEILELRGHPVTEEQAWALCYQLCTLLRDCSSERVGPGHERPQTPRLPGAEGILFCNDGSVCLKDSFVFSKEEQVVDQLGRLIYYCLDWGLEHDVERDLHDALARLVCRMTNVNSRTDESLLTTCLLQVIQVCEDRLGGPAHASHHYKTVCSSLFSESIELYKYIQSHKSSSKSLQTFLESDMSLATDTDSNQIHAWKCVIEELQVGTPLRPCWRTFSSSAYQPPEKLFPFDQLKQAIELKQYTLRKVQSSSQHGKVGENSLKDTNPHYALMKAIRARPKLRPVSERKLRDRPDVEPCLHERLMAEIRMTDPQKLFASCKKRRAAQIKVESQQISSHCIKPSTFITQIGQVYDRHLQPFNPTGLNITSRKRRAQSVGSYSDCKRSRKSCGIGTVPVTVGMIMRAEHTEINQDEKTIPETNPGRWQVCSCCSSRSRFFTWHNTCSRCNRVVCPSCCVKMQVPYKWCLNLPVTFFRKIVLSQSAVRDHSHFWKERASWDCTKVPLVLEPLSLSSCSQHSLAMRDWHSQDICIQCQGLLEETCDSVAIVNHVTGTQEI